MAQARNVMMRYS